MANDVRGVFNRYLLDHRDRSEQAGREIVARARSLGLTDEGPDVWEPLNPFPILLSRAERDSAYRIAELISLALEREAAAGDADLRSRCNRIGLPATAVDAACALQPASVSWWCRVDLQPASDGSWRLIEVNVGSGMAGPFVPELFYVQRGAAVLENYLARERFEGSDPAGAYVDELCRHWRSQGENGVVAFVDWPGYFHENCITLQKLARLTSERGAPAIACDLSRLSCPAGRLLVDNDTPCSVVSANYLLEDVLGHGTSPLEPLVQAARAGSLRLVMGLHGEVVGSKLGPQEVLTSRATAELSPRDLELLQQAIPMTRMLEFSEAELAWLQDHRTQLVLKPIIGSKGVGVVIGPQTSAQAWSAALRSAANTCSHVVQDYVAPCPWQLPELSDDGALVITDILPQISIYTLQGKPVGVLARTKPSQLGGVMSIYKGARWMSVLTPMQ